MKASAHSQEIEWAPTRHRLRLDIQKSRHELEELQSAARAAVQAWGEYLEDDGHFDVSAMSRHMKRLRAAVGEVANA